MHLAERGVIGDDEAPERRMPGLLVAELGLRHNRERCDFVEARQRARLETCIGQPLTVEWRALVESVQLRLQAIELELGELLGRGGLDRLLPVLAPRVCDCHESVTLLVPYRP